MLCFVFASADNDSEAGLQNNRLSIASVVSAADGSVLANALKLTVDAMTGVRLDFGSQRPRGAVNVTLVASDAVTPSIAFTQLIQLSEGACLLVCVGASVRFRLLSRCHSVFAQ